MNILRSYTGLMGIIALFLVVLKYFIAPLYKSKTTIGTQNKVNYWIGVAVFFIENIYFKEDKGPEKKQWVENIIKNKFNINNDELNQVIEYTVFEINKIKTENNIKTINEEKEEEKEKEKEEEGD